MSAARALPRTAVAAGCAHVFADAAIAPDAAAIATVIDPVFLTEFAECLLESGQTKAAEERLRAAIRTYPPEQKKETALALRRLAGIWQAEKRNEEAAGALLQRADSLDPGQR